MKQICLKDWQLAYCDIGAWQPEDAAAQPTIPCAVPGAVHLALLQAGIIDEPLEKLNMERCRFVEDKDFWHTVTFTPGPDFRGERVLLTFEGVDVNADYYLNGRHLGHSENAFYPAEFDVTGLLLDGENTLTVRVNEGVAAERAKGKSLDFMELSWNKDEPYRGYLRKPQFCYGWDWARRLTTCGIYKPVYLRSYDKAHFADVYVHSHVADGTAEVEVDCPVEFFGDAACTVRCTVTTDAAFEAERTVAAVTAPAGDGKLAFTIENPQLWWCNGYGNPYLYTVKLELLDASGAVLDTAVRRHGVRTLTLRQAPIGDRGDKTFTFVLNGTPVFAKGANWVPVDQIIGRITAERYEFLIRCALDMNMNMFRVWGGGFYESDTFMDLCDRLGMLVWHDFMFACSYYPDFDAEFVENVRREAVYQVKNKRGHACFIGWSGNNENYSMYEGHIKNVEKPFPFYSKKIYEEVLAPICAAYDPERPFRLSSPWGGDCADDIREGDQHFWGTYHDFHELYGDFFRIAESKASFVSEFGMIAPLNLESLKKCCDADQLYPQSEQWRFHSNTGDNFEKILSQYFDVVEPCKTIPLEQYILMGQAIQAEVIRSAFDKYRSEKFLCSGALFWMYSDCYPTSGWCFVDYYGNKKPLYYYTKRAFAPVGIFFSGYNPNALQGMREYRAHYTQNGAALRIALTSDLTRSVSLDCTVRVMTLAGKTLLSETFAADLPENSAKPDAYTVDVTPCLADCDPCDLVVLCTASLDGEIMAENRCFLAPFKDLHLEKTPVHCEAAPCGDAVTLTLTADRYVWLCHLPHDEGVFFDNNDFDLVPGTPVRVTVSGPAAKDYKFRCLTMNDCLPNG